MLSGPLRVELQKAHGAHVFGLFGYVSIWKLLARLHFLIHSHPIWGMG